MALSSPPLLVRELSWLSFNDRVLQEAADPTVPLLERLRFMGIFSANQDEFFRIRVAALRRMARLNKRRPDDAQSDPVQVLRQIQKRVLQQQEAFERQYERLIGELAEEGIYILNEKRLNEEQVAYLRDYFTERLQASLAPILLNHQVPTPQLRDREVYLAVQMYHSAHPQKRRYALLEVPVNGHPRFVRLPSPQERHDLILLDDVIRLNLGTVFKIFPFDTFNAYTVKFTRDAAPALPEENPAAVPPGRVQVPQRPATDSDTVRFVYDQQMPKPLLSLLKKRLGISRYDSIIPGGRYHNFRDLRNFPDLGRPELRAEPPSSIPHPFVQYGTSFLDTIARQDVMLFHPYHSFDYFLDFLREAAINPEVTQIKINLYRPAPKSKVVNALINAIKNGKRVTAVVALQTRFDEARNMEVANALQNAGCNVVPGVTGLMVHTRLCLVKGRQAQYAYISTSHFNEKTAQYYLDASLFTVRDAICRETDQLFKFLQRGYELSHYQHLMVAPLYMRESLLSLIQRETESAREGKKAWILLKLNHLTDRSLIEALYQASQAGVQVDLIIRGACSLVAGHPRWSANIRAISIVDWTLEHMRAAVFGNRNHPAYYLGSADWMPANMEHQVEVFCPILDPILQAQLQQILRYQLQDKQKARIISHYQIPENTRVREQAPQQETPFYAQREIQRYLQAFHDKLSSR